MTSHGCRWALLEPRLSVSYLLGSLPAATCVSRMSAMCVVASSVDGNVHVSSLALLFGIGIPHPREVGWLALVMEVVCLRLGRNPR